MNLQEFCEKSPKRVLFNPIPWRDGKIATDARIIVYDPEPISLPPFDKMWWDEIENSDVGQWPKLSALEPVSSSNALECYACFGRGVTGTFRRCICEEDWGECCVLCFGSGWLGGKTCRLCDGKKETCSLAMVVIDDFGFSRAYVDLILKNMPNARYRLLRNVPSMSKDEKPVDAVLAFSGDGGGRGFLMPLDPSVVAQKAEE